MRPETKIPLLSAASLTGLLVPETQPCVSLVVRVEHGPHGAEAAKLRLKNLLAAARDHVAQELRPHETDALLQPAEDALTDKELWHDLAGGLALYLSPGVAHRFRVPAPASTVGLVADQFALAPVLHAVMPDVSFHVLAISQNKCTLYSGSRHSMERTHLEGLPDNLEDALWYESHENVLNRHSTSRGGRTTAISGTSASDERKEQIDRYMRKIDDVLCASLGASGALLVVAAVEREASAFKEQTHYTHVISGGLAGSPDRMSTSELHDAAWDLLQADLGGVRAAAMERHRELAGTGRTSHDLQHIVTLASQGGIETLFVSQAASEQNSGGQNSGDQNADEQSRHVNHAVVDTLRTGGAVHPCDSLVDAVADGGPVPLLAATLRPGHL